MRERERENRGSKLSSIHEFSSVKTRHGVKVALRDESSAWVPESQDFTKAQGSGFFSRN